jgi:hypothetical protein
MKGVVLAALLKVAQHILRSRHGLLD